MFIIAIKSLLLSIIAQLSSHNCYEEINDELANSGNMCVRLAVDDKPDSNGRIHLPIEAVDLLFGDKTEGPGHFLYVVTRLYHPPDNNYCWWCYHLWQLLFLNSTGRGYKTR